MESNVYFSINGDKKKLNFKPTSTIWLKDIFEEVYEKYIYYYREWDTKESLQLFHKKLKLLIF